MTGTAPRVTGVLETSLYVADLERSRAFYQELLGLAVFLLDERMCALEVPGRQVLLLFRRGASLQPSPTPGGMIPPHDGHGTLHLAFAVAAADLAIWERRLAEHGIAVESRVKWPAGGTSVYFRDPDNHSLEFATPGLWPNYLHE
jgi:catechol 2,3-dioxygenase-like lactoylglutathione lyase family enzyme